MSRLERFRPYPVSAFAGVTLLIWGNRIWLAWTNQEDTVAEKLVWSTPITLFVAAALVILVLQFRGAAGGRGFTRIVKAFAGGTGIYWAIRLPMILTGDWGVPFKAVHTVLAVASVAAAVLAWRSVDRDVVAGSSDTSDAIGASALR